MKFGVLQFFSWNRRVPIATVYDRAFDRIRIMDEGGFDAVWLAEHHFNDYSVCPSVTIMATHVAAMTQRVRIGTAVTLAPFYQPLRLAEELSLVDHFSGGRLNWGAGRGFEPTEFRAFGVPVEESAARFLEAVDVVLNAWTNDRLNHDGQHWRFEDVEVLPKPLQQPHPPVWLAATSPESIRRAAERGHAILMDPHASHAEIGRKRRLYREILAEHGFEEGGRDIPVARLLAIGHTDAEAEDTARRGAMWTVGSYAQPRGRDNLPGVDRQPGQDPVERYVDDVIIHGSPQRVVDEIERLRAEQLVEYLMAAPLSHESFVLFITQVLPRLH